MRLGLFSFNTEYTMRADRLARAAEERGFESLWLPEHTHIPVPEGDADPETGMPPMPGGGYLPEEYRHMADPFVSLAAAAAATTRLLLGTCICLVNQHHPITLAKRVATLDRISDGRFVFGVGAGWNVQEMGHHGIRFEDRWKQATERLEAIRTLWREERPGFEGEHVRFSPSWQYPKPLRPAGPPILLGTLDTPFGRDKVARHGDGWLPLTFGVERARRSIADVRERMRAAGRDPDGLDVSLFFLEDREQTEGAIRAAGDTGVTRAILRLPVAGEDEVLRALDRYAAYLA
ncbi:MAG: TIGR03619 family F420-dependent LLM class oxidoreductase [Sphingomonadales bacterium]